MQTVAERVTSDRIQALLDSARLDVAGLPLEERQSAYLAEINHTLDTEFLTAEVVADMASCYLGELHVIRAVAAPRRSERTAALIARDRHDGISIQLAIAGRAHGQAGARRIVSDPGTIMVLDFGQPFQVTDLEWRDIINVAIPRAILGRHIADLRALHGMVLKPRDAGLLASLLGAVAPRVAELPREAGAPLADAIIELTLLALGYDPRGARRTPADRRAALAERARRLIDSRLAASDLSPEWLAAKLNMSRSDLYSLFENAGGVAKFIWRRRLDAAHTALLDPGDARRIGEIAFAYGFSSEAHFSRAFRQAFGATASALRRAGQ